MKCPKCKFEFKDPGRQKGGMVENSRKGFGSNKAAQRKAQRTLRSKRVK